MQGMSSIPHSKMEMSIQSRLEAHHERIGRTAEQDMLFAEDILVLTGDTLTSESSSPMYSGFLKVGGENEGGALHYFLAETDSAETAPLVLWLNGGPGS